MRTNFNVENRDFPHYFDGLFGKKKKLKMIILFYRQKNHAIIREKLFTFNLTELLTENSYSK